jgi:hypothetical protein
MSALLKWLRETDLIGLGIELGVGLFILISLVRCAWRD